MNRNLVAAQHDILSDVAVGRKYRNDRRVKFEIVERFVGKQQQYAIQSLDMRPVHTRPNH